MSRSTIVIAASFFAALCEGTVGAEIGSGPQSGVLSKQPDDILTRRSGVSTLHINNVRLEAPPPEVPKPSTLLKFDMINEGALRITDILIEIAILEKPNQADESSPPRVVAGPFTVSGHATIEAGYTVNYELLLRNLSSDCQCMADVNAVSARSLPEPGP